MDQAVRIARTLCEPSRTKAVDPYGELLDKLPEQLSQEQWFMPPELVSLSGTPEFQALTEAEQKRLSFFEVVNLFSFTVHGERIQVEGLAERLYQKELTEVTPYLHHFLAEENDHMAYFGGFCMKYVGKLYPPTYQKLAIEREYAPGERDLLFFAKLLMFEELGDAYNIRIAKDERVVPIVREINRLHHKDEARHLAFGRQVVRALFERHSPSWSAEALRGVRRHLSDYLVASWWEFYNARVYRDAGVPGDAMDLRDRAFDDERGRAHRRSISADMIRYLIDTGILQDEPELS